MYLYLGGNTVIPEEDVIGVFDLDNTSSSHITREFLTAREAARELESLAEGLPRYFTVTRSGRVYLSQYAGRPVL
jgi:hypothetical protein